MSCCVVLECAICIESMSTNDLFYTPCSHVFHLKCITEWLKISKICPHCRQAVSANKLRRLYINSSKFDLDTETKCRKSLMNAQHSQILDFRSKLNMYKVQNSCDQQMIAKLSKELEENQREARGTIVALCLDLEEARRKLKSQHFLNFRLRTDLKASRSELQALEEKFKALEKSVPPIANPMKVKKTNAKVNKPMKIKIEPKSSEPNQIEPIAARTRSRTLAKK